MPIAIVKVRYGAFSKQLLKFLYTFITSKQFISPQIKTKRQQKHYAIERKKKCNKINLFIVYFFF